MGDNERNRHDILLIGHVTLCKPAFEIGNRYSFICQSASTRR